MGHRLSSVLALTTALFGVSSVYLLWQRTRDDICTQTDPRVAKRERPTLA
jgi:hypothetical protein